MHCLRALACVLLMSPLLAAQPPDPPPPGTHPPGFGLGYADDMAPARRFKELIPGLIEALKDSDADVRQHSAMALAALGRDAMKPLGEALKDPVKEKRAAAAYALGQMGYLGADSMPVLLTALKDEEAIVRRSASQAISRILREGPGYGRAMTMMPAYPGPGTFGAGQGLPPPGPPGVPPPPPRPQQAPTEEKPKKEDAKPDKTL
jgi:HEAT repeat protein